MLGGFVQKTGIDFDGSNTDLSPVQSLKITGAVAVANGPGDDVLDIGDATLVTSIAGAVVVANGAGDNHTDIDGTNSLTVGGPIRVTGGIGVDYNHFGLNSTLVTLGSLIVNGGAGDGLNDTKVMGIELNVAGNLTVFGGSGPDSVSINSMQDGMIVGAVTTSLGTGSNVLTANAENGATLMFGKTLIVQSATTAANGNTVELRNVKVQGATFIKTGAGNDFITIDDGIFSGKFTLITAGGADIVNIEQNAGWTEHTQFNSATTILTGAGVDKVYVSGIIAESTRKTIFCSTVKIDGGLDSDTLAMSSLANEFFGLAPVTTGF
jgi:hypothetical protein